MTVRDYCQKYGKTKPAPKEGVWNVWNITAAKVMLGTHVSEEVAEWYCEYYKTMYPSFEFDVCSLVRPIDIRPLTTN